MKNWILEILYHQVNATAQNVLDIYLQYYIAMSECTEVCDWYCSSFCSCGLKKIILQKVFLFEIGLIFIYVWLKLLLKLKLNKK
jgi:hypothetical protein